MDLNKLLPRKAYLSWWITKWKHIQIGKTDINFDMIITAEKFLAKCTDSKTNCENFDELRMEYYHHNNKFNLEKIPPTSKSIHKHIQRAFLQSHIWYNSCFIFGIIHNSV